ncbi:hypothetical protein ABT093_20795 [Kitasatospora sp. NPDC002551]|uniref:hypothetical protein n=1 Tax=unclassified Kitasatospora TaxID=2633591 RepID=UPI00331EDB01
MTDDPQADYRAAHHRRQHGEPDPAALTRAYAVSIAALVVVIVLLIISTIRHR